MKRKSHIDRLFETADKLAALDLSPLSNEELEAEISAARERAESLSDEEIEKQFEEALKTVRARAKELGITQEDIDNEIRIVRQIRQIEEDLAEFEKQYGMTTAEFFKKFMAGETDDRMDFVEWAGLAQMLAHLQEE